MNNNHKLPDLAKQYNLLSTLQQRFKNEFRLTACVGVEIEFYLQGIDDILWLEEKIGHKIKEEKGKDQYEVDLEPSDDLVFYAKSVSAIRQKIIDSAMALGGRADFSSKPFIDDYGSSMHVHLNFLEDDNIEKYAKILCYFLPETIDAFLPKKEDYLRLDSKFMAPTHIAYGGNNRSVLIRIPDSLPKRLEHRLAAADAEPAGVLCVMLGSIEKGLKNPELVEDMPKIFGNAFDQQYNLKKIQ
jgi:glutamine synthetase